MGKRLRDEEEIRVSSDAETLCEKKLKPFEVFHYKEEASFPVFFENNFPSIPYESRFGQVKTAIHWGQRKLLLSEVQLLALCAEPHAKYHIVYAGAAPGTHLSFLDDLFHSRHTWELVDPGKFDLAVLGNRDNFKLRNEFFTNEVAYEIARDRMTTRTGLKRLHRVLTAKEMSSSKIGSSCVIQEELKNKIGELDVARGTHDIPSMYEEPVTMPIGLTCLFSAAMERKTLFISDIRSGSVAHSNFEDHVYENMRAQQCWTEIIRADFSLLKFRLPYTRKTRLPGDISSYVKSHLIDPNGTVEYLRGKLFLPIWTRPTSTEARLLVPSGAWRTRYNVEHYENQCFYFNSVLREVVHFNHILAAGFDHHFDSAAEVHIFTVVAKLDAAERGEVLSDKQLLLKVWELIKKTTEFLGMTFKDAIRKRDNLILRMASSGLTVEQIYNEELRGGGGGKEKDGNCTTGKQWTEYAKKLLDAAMKERKRKIWSQNIDLKNILGVSENVKNCLRIKQ